MLMERLGHGERFVAFEQPDLFVREVRECFRPMRQKPSLARKRAPRVTAAAWPESSRH